MQAFIKKTTQQEFLTMPYAIRNLMLILIISIALYAQAAQALELSTTTYYKQLIERLQVEQELEPLDASLAGDSIDYFTGSASFSVTDVSIPGNFPIPVQINRTLSAGKEAFRHFGDWELNMPRITGKYNDASHFDCQNSFPYPVESPRGHIYVSGTWYFKGLTLHDGNGYSGLLIPIGSVENPPFAIPAGYSYYTKDHWLVRCAGKNFVALSPTGLTYTYDKIVSDPVIDETCINGDEDCITTSSYAMRVSKIEDRFGNFVNYNYNALAQLENISASDGRLITLQYLSHPGLYYHMIDRIEANGRSWQYRYRLTSTGYPSALYKVELPENKKWEYALFSGNCPSGSNCAPSAGSYRYSDPSQINFDQPSRSAATMTYSVTHPEGAKIDYLFYELFLHRFDQGIRVVYCSTAGGNHCPPPSRSCTTVHCKGRTPTLALIRKTLHASANQQYVWNYTYSESEKFPNIYVPGSSGNPINEAVTRQTTTIIGPDNITEIVYHRRYDWKEGAELWRVVKNLDGTEISRTSKDWIQGPDYGIPNVSRTMLNRTKAAIQSRLTQDKQETQGSLYATQYSDFNQFGIPKNLYEYNNFSTDKLYTQKEFYHDEARWLINMPTTTAISSNGSNYVTTSETTYHSSGGIYKSLPYEEKVYGNWLKRYASYHLSGVNAGSPYRIEYNEKLKQANGSESNHYRYRELVSFKRGRPETVRYSARYNDTTTVSESQAVDDNGWITSITNLNGHTSNYKYNTSGRLVSVDLPGVWKDTLFEWGAISNGKQIRTLKRCTLTTDRTACSDTPLFTQSNTYDGMLRSVLSVKTDTTSNISRYQNRRFNSENKTLFESYWSEQATEREGITTVYDSLQRVKSVSQSGGGTELTDYLANNKIRTTNSRGHVTTTTYLAYGSPSVDVAKITESPENVITSQAINIFGDITSITQTGPGKNGVGTVSQTEHRAYDANHQLCKTQRNDVGMSVFSNNLLGEVLWAAEGVSGGTVNDCSSNVSNTEKILVSYDNLGGSRSINYPDASPDITYTRDPEGNLLQLVAGTTIQDYHYNDLNMLEDETLRIDGRLFILDYEYNTLGHMTSIIYPDNTQVNYAPNGFGEATRAINNIQPYAQDVHYYPNGMVDRFTFGNGLQHKVTLNNRRLPDSLRDASTEITAVDYAYTYDNENNVTSITDRVNSAFSITDLRYDGLDRLTGTTGNTGIGSSTLNYDGLGNITGYTTKNSTLDYHYDTNNNRLATVTGTKPYSFQYTDGRGNVTHNGARGFSFNRANQITSSGSNSYVYDGYNRRVKTQDSKGTSYSLYSKSGVLLFREAAGRGINYIYLGKQLIAKEGVFTDASSSLQHYKPFGETIESPKDEVGYTGHKFDTDLGLSYMQARYYDPAIGRFYSNDPIGFRDLHSFNRYTYANNNPFKYTDPDGKLSQGFVMNYYHNPTANVAIVGTAAKSATKDTLGDVSKGADIVAIGAALTGNLPLAGVAEGVSYAAGMGEAALGDSPGKDMLTETVAEVTGMKTFGTAEKIANGILGDTASSVVKNTINAVSEVGEQAVENMIEGGIPQKKLDDHRKIE